MIDEPNISISKKSNEENMQAVKAWAGNIVEQLQYLSNRVEALESQASSESED